MERLYNVVAANSQVSKNYNPGNANIIVSCLCPPYLRYNRLLAPLSMTKNQ
ncbi:hypothetical protein [Coleofasciculus sp.]|uniref:hypothetical protein n=1 Tax=Coleofasciculus sp. TaxID=3100458 RepID=UPI003A3C3319